MKIFDDGRIVGGIGARHIKCAERGERDPGKGDDENAQFLDPPYHVLVYTRGRHAGPLSIPSHKRSGSMITLRLRGI